MGGSPADVAAQWAAYAAQSPAHMAYYQQVQAQYAQAQYAHQLAVAQAQARPAALTIHQSVPNPGRLRVRY